MRDDIDDEIDAVKYDPGASCCATGAPHPPR